jgi:hypothetical protein
MKIGLLIAVDPIGVRADLRCLFHREFPGVHIDEAGTTTETRNLLDEHLDRAVRYSVVILDNRLPPGEGKAPACSLAPLEPYLWKAVIDPPAYFILSANPLDPKVQECRLKVARRRENWDKPDDGPPLPTASYAPRLYFYPKGGPGWDEQLRNAARPLIHAKRIDAGLKEIRPLFGRGSGPALASRSHPSAGFSGRARAEYLPGINWNNRLALLVRDIEDHWLYLEKELRDEVEKYFVVRKGDGGRVDVTLL